MTCVIDRVFPSGRLTVHVQGAALAPLVRCADVSELFAEEVADFHEFSRSEIEGDPAEAVVSQPDAEAAACERSNSFIDGDDSAY